MQLDDMHEHGYTPDPAQGGGWADFQAARERFLVMCRRQAELARLEATFAAPARERGVLESSSATDKRVTSA